MSNIGTGRRPSVASAEKPATSVPSWTIRLDPSLLEHVPPLLLTCWLAIESFCRNRPSCWPGNAALAKRLGVKGPNRVQERLLELEDHGVIERRPLGSNRRAIVLRRRVAEPLSGSEWAAAVASADQRKAERAAKKRKPALRIVSPDDLSRNQYQAPGNPGANLSRNQYQAPGNPVSHPPGNPGAKRTRLRANKDTNNKRAAG